MEVAHSRFGLPELAGIPAGMFAGRSRGEPLIPDSVRRLILEKLDCVAEMEALLLLRSTPDQSWDAGSLASRLYVSENEADHLLQGLAGRGFFVRDQATGSHRYGPESPELAETVRHLAEHHRTRLIPLTKLIHSKCSSSVQQLADAFLLWR